MSARRQPALILFWVSTAVLIAGVLLLGGQRWIVEQDAEIESVGSRPAYTASASASPSTPSASPVPTPSSSASPSPVEPVRVAAPVAVRIPAIDVDTKVFPVALDENQAIEIPEDIRYVGWYELGMPPGVDRGSAVLVAHRDGREQGRGVFYYLGTLEPGDKVYVKTSAGDVLPYKVVSRESISKKRLPYEELFAIDGDPRLTLISCGGYYDRNNGGYQDNVVVTAVPLFDPIQIPSAEEIASASPSASASASATVGAAAPVSVAAPEAATVSEFSVPVLLDGSSLPAPAAR